jgi:acyl-CoA reductase-like NAD-dependent aldehyde dehydrogenase
MTTAVKTIPPPARNMAAEEVSRKAHEARLAQALWRRYSLSERVDIIRALWREICDRREELLSVIHDETGKPFAEIVATELAPVEMIVGYFTSNAHRILQDQAAWRPWLLFNKRAYVHYVPRGLIGLVTPWNLPFLIPLGDTFAAMLAGNAVLLKPSEWTTRIALWVEDAIKATGLLPDGLFAVVTGDGTVGKQVVELSDMILFTGSTKAGRLVGQAAAADLKPVVLELGGKHPMVVLKDAAIERAAKAAVWGAFANCGQMCVGVERVYVEEAAYEPFVEAVRREMAGLRQGLDGKDVDIGRMIFPPQFERVREQLEEARAKGGKVIGGDVLDEANLMISPALVLEATPEMRVMKEETFGPIMPIMRVENEEEAIRLANSLPFGLAASLWSVDIKKAERLGSMIEAGLLSINDMMTHYALCSLPFGGVKSSGLGRRHSDEGLRMFCWPQSVFVHEWPAKAPELWWFPYNDFKTKLVSWISRLA